MNKKYSFGDFLNQNFKSRPANEFDNSEIIGSCFYQEVTYGNTLPVTGIDIFPDDMTGVIFKRCNLDNVYIPAGNTVESDKGVDSSTKQIMADDEGLDCLVKNNAGTLEPDKTKRV